MRFSERYGHKKVRETLQVESMDYALRNGLWSLLHANYWNRFKTSRHMRRRLLNSTNNKELYNLFLSLWLKYFKEPVDSISCHWDDVLEKIKTYYYSCAWFEVYDFIEFIANNYMDQNINIKFMDNCNKILKVEKSGYSFIDGKITPITDQVEIDEIEEALNISNDLIRTHLNSALKLLSNRTDPDYRNSMKESISAVECLTKQILADNSGKFDKLINKIEKQLSLHKSLKSAFQQLFAYSSDASGIRHALKDQPNVDLYDAKFMLVTCSAFVNYVIGKNEKLKS